MKKIAAIGDCHGDIDSLTRLYSKLEWLSLDEIWGLGDLIDRGPDSGGVVQFFREKRMRCVMGNHDHSILLHYDRVLKGGHQPLNPEKARTLTQLTPDDIDYLRSLPHLHVMDDLKTVLVHGGLWPSTSIHNQPINVIRAQLIHPNQFGVTRWWGPDATRHKCKKSEADSRLEGFHRWYSIYDWTYDVVYGHSVFNQPFVHQNPGCGRTIGVDTGSVFGGALTAAILDGSDPWFVAVKAKQIWSREISRCLWEI